MVEDTFGFPDKQSPVRMVFGCENGETGEIYRQMADGIMGMGNNNNAFQSQVGSAQRRVPCLNTRLAGLTVGGQQCSHPAVYRGHALRQELRYCGRSGLSCQEAHPRRNAACQYGNVSQLARQGIAGCPASVLLGGGAPRPPRLRFVRDVWFPWSSFVIGAVANVTGAV
jgi:hypothetical protein